MTDTRIAPPLVPVIGNDGKQRFTDAPFFSTLKLALRLPNDSAFGNPFADWHSWDKDEIDPVTRKPTGKRIPREKDRKGSKLTRPNARDADVRNAQYVRITGMVGYVNLPSRTYTVNAKASRNVPNHVSGLPPCDTTEPLARVTAEWMLLSDPELRHLRRYRNAMKGAAYAASMEREQRERDRAYWREALPYWPLDKAGRFMVLKDDGSFSDGTTLRERVASWKEHNAEHAEQMEARSAKLSRQAELAELVAAQSEDDAETRRTARKVRQQNIKRSRLTGKLHF